MPVEHTPGIVIGVDVGTSGCRAIALDRNEQVVAEAHWGLPPSIRRAGGVSEQHPQDWWAALVRVLSAITGQLGSEPVDAVLIDGTSSTVLACGADGNVSGPALMYDDTRSASQLASIKDHAPSDSAVHSASSSLAKLLHLAESGSMRNKQLLHQSDWLSGKLTGIYDVSDENNCLKLGYDPVERRWPEWLDELPIDRVWLPRAVPPGTPVGRITLSVAKLTGLSTDTLVLAGTTDSTASFVATGASEPGEAVTALGSTLVLKILSDQPIFNPEYGVYSHRLGDRWLVGGASNSGGAVLRSVFTVEQMAELSKSVDPLNPTGFNYYPLPGPGERFPINDPGMQPRMEPRPDSNLMFIQALLEGIADIEKLGYERLAELGAPELKTVYTTGGGAANDAWRLIRQRKLGVAVREASHKQAAYGSAILARRALSAAMRA